MDLANVESSPRRLGPARSSNVVEVEGCPEIGDVLA